jgi:hypothetical protein
LPQNKLKHALPITIQQPCSLVFIWSSWGLMYTLMFIAALLLINKM